MKQRNDRRKEGKVTNEEGGKGEEGQQEQVRLKERKEE